VFLDSERLSELLPANSVRKVRARVPASLAGSLDGAYLFERGKLGDFPTTALSNLTPIFFLTREGDRSESIREENDRDMIIELHIANHTNRTIRLSRGDQLGGLVRLQDNASILGEREGEDLEEGFAFPRSEPDRTPITDDELNELCSRFDIPPGTK